MRIVMKPAKPSTVDFLAESLSRKTGTKFSVLRTRPPLLDFFDKPIPGKYGQMKYGLKAEREDVNYVFQRSRLMTLDELRRWLASINDMVSMGFIPVSRHEGG